MHVLFEHAVGYSLFRVNEFEEIGLLQPEVEKSVTDLSRFSSIIKLVAFSPFKSSADSLDNMNSISEGKRKFHGIISALLPPAIVVAER